MPLTTRQTQFYELLKDYFDFHGQSPTLDELKSWLEHHGWGEIRSLNSLTQYLETLEDAGKLRREGRKRGIILLDGVNTVRIPVFPNPVACGPATNLIDETAEEYRSISKRIVHAPERTYLFVATGDSMDRAGIEEDDLVVIEATNDLKDNDIVLANIDGCGTFKRFRKGWDTITLSPESSNPEHEPIYLHADDDFVIGGKVINVLKS